MTPIHLAIFWHQHQPYYPDDVSGETLMPWVRLHGTKDYYGMALHLKEVPEFRCTINLVPSLLLQIEQFVAGREDRHLEVSRMPADGLSQADVSYLLDNFFMANADSMIRPFARYQELYLKRGFGVDGVENAIRRFSEKDLRDLQVWSNLTWMHELAFVNDPELDEFRKKGRHWTEEEKQWLLDKQREILAKIIPLHKELAQSGQIELTTTPFFHPILPLLWNKRSAHQAMPGCALPQNLDSYAEDARDPLATRHRVPREALRREAGRHVAERRQRVARHRAGDRRRRHQVDRDRRRDPRREHRRLGRTRRPGPHPQSGTSLPPVAGREGRQRTADGLPRPRDERSRRLPLSTQRPAPRCERSAGSRRSHGACDRRQERRQAVDRARHSRRRELLGVLPRRRRRLPADALSNRSEASAHSAGARFAITSRNIRRTTASITCTRGRGSATTSRSGSATTRTTPPGTACTKRASF